MKKQDSGFLITELIVTLGVLLTILACFATLLGQVRELGRYNLCRQQCTQAAMAQLDSISVTGKPLPGDKINELWDGVTTKIEIADGVGQWEGMKLVKVRSASYLRHKEIVIELARYTRQSGE